MFMEKRYGILKQHGENAIRCPSLNAKHIPTCTHTLSLTLTPINQRQFGTNTGNASYTKVLTMAVPDEKDCSVWSVCKNPQQKSDMSYSSSKKAYQRRQGEMTIRLRWFHAPAISNCRFNKMNFLWLLYKTGITYSTVDKNHCSQYFCSLNLYTVRQPSIQIQEMSHSLYFN